MVSILFAFSFLPQVVLFVGQMLVSRDGALDYFTENAEVLWQVPTAVFLLALYYGSIGLALSSVTTRRIVAGASFIGLLLLTSIVAAILIGVDERGAGALLNLLGTPLAIRDLVFLGHMDPEESLGGVANAGLYSVGIYTAVIAAALGTLFWRYRYAEA
jgi:hypothetical protein